MNGIASKSAGVLLLPKPGGDDYIVFDLAEGEEVDSSVSQYLYSPIHDWEEIEGSNSDDLLRIASEEYWTSRAVSYLQLAIGGLDESLESGVLEHVEELAGSHSSSEKILNRLLIAPLARVDSLVPLAGSALSQGFTVVASLLDELRELQPLIKKLTDHWLGMDASDYSQLPVPKEEVWRTIVETSTIKQLLTAGGKGKFISEWNNLAFNLQTPQSRIGVITLGQKLAERLFPHEQVQEVAPDSSWNETDLESGDQREEVVSTHEAFERVKKQIAAIAESVSQGNDAKAERFLKDLVNEQTSFSQGEKHAVKSLCNIAQKCAEMFRMDFEKICLDEARRLLPTDSWTLIQYGDHLNPDYSPAPKFASSA